MFGGWNKSGRAGTIWPEILHYWFPKQSTSKSKSKLFTCINSQTILHVLFISGSARQADTHTHTNTTLRPLTYNISQEPSTCRSHVTLTVHFTQGCVLFVRNGNRVVSPQAIIAPQEMRCPKEKGAALFNIQALLVSTLSGRATGTTQPDLNNRSSKKNSTIETEEKPLKGQIVL